MLVIFSKLDLALPDRTWIDQVRREHDPQCDLVEPHFTLVFPFEGVPVERVAAHATTVAAATHRFAFRLSKAAAVRDALGPKTHVFLAPADGADELRRLHTQLYSGALAAKLHPTIPFVPHVTVGAFDEATAAERLASSLEPLDILGAVDAMVLAEFEGPRLTELHSFRFT
jgi:2'-5' RNA ligase